MNQTIDSAYCDTSTYSIFEERKRQIRKVQMFSPQYLKPIELSPLSDLIHYLNQFKNVGDNWDGYGAIAPSETAIENAIDFLNRLPSGYQKTLNSDEVKITTYGTVIMEWYEGENNFISIEVGNSKIGFFSETPDGKNPIEQSIEFTRYAISNQIIPALNKVFTRA